MKKTVITACVSALLLSTSLYAGGDMKRVNAAVEPYVEVPVVKSEKYFYAGLGASVAQVESYFYGKDTVKAVTARAGYNFSKYMGVEFRGSKGVSDGCQLGWDYSYGLYLKPQYPVNEDLTLYALLGYAQTKISFDNEVAFNGISNNYTTQNDFSFGAGAEYKLNESWSLYLDVMRMIDKETTRPEGKYASRVNGVGFGVVFHF